ncbi:MAG: hypothetical protein IJV08_05765 [Bacteroidaceae bacterium]|nr:hypothetical protein [Bacteroidaceae bacterium]
MKRILIFCILIAKIICGYGQTIVNPSFEKEWNGWTQNGMSLQNNDVFSIKDGTTYAERWTGRGNAVGDGSVLQTVKGISCGKYRLTVAAQNIQEDAPNVTKTGAWIVGEGERTAIGVRGDYSVTFTVVTGDALIGFVAEGAQGNWIACDNFRLEYLGADAEAQKAEMASRVAAAEALATEKMNATVLADLQNAISAAKNAPVENYAEVGVALRAAVEQAEASISSYKLLLSAIEEAGKVCATGAGNERAALQTVIDEAQALYDSDTAENDAMKAKAEALKQAVFAYRLANATGTVPRVTTDPRYARGAIAAFGRMSVSGVSASMIMEKGFCWSTEPNPTVLDNRTTNYLSSNGEIYVMPMQPATVYYIRAYAMTKTYAVGYGKVIKISTLPMGRVTYTYDNGGDQAQNNRIKAALDDATYYWSNYTSIQGFNVSCVYSPGTPTADCGYGGNMRMGSNMGQRCGTCMHEMNHGIGGGTTEIWGGWTASPLRTTVNGDWAGERANAVLRFWENREDLVITAAYDGAHWGFRTKDGTYSHDNNWLNKYAFNGAHLEPGAWAGPQDWNGTQIVYIGNALINQAMCEDGLIPVNYYAGGFCLPAYVFEQDDQKKYYIKSESTEHGLYDSFLVEGKTRKVTYVAMDCQTAAENDSAAWYITFDPKTQRYMMRNAATGNYLTYASGFKTVSRSTPSANDKFHLMRGRKDEKVGNLSVRGYWIIHPENSGTPPTMTASSAGNVTSSPLNLYDSATPQRWVFVGADQLAAFDAGTVKATKDELMAYIKQLKKLQNTPHTEDVEGTDEFLTHEISDIESASNSASTVAEIKNLLTDARMAGVEFLSNATPADPSQPFDLTFMVPNASITSSSCWTGNATYDVSCCEFFQRTFDFSQTISGLPKGNFKLMAQAFQRPGAYETAYNAYARGSNQVSAVLYAGSESQKIKHIGEDAQGKKVHNEDVTVGTPAVYIPNTMASAAAYFKKKLYDNEVWAETAQMNASLKIGLRGTVTKDGYWTICDNFRLYYYGKLTQETVTGIAPQMQENSDAKDSEAVYDLQGRRLLRPTKGIIVRNGRKIIVKQ